jgi:hypothetical protein
LAASIDFLCIPETQLVYSLLRVPNIINSLILYINNSKA